MNLGLTDKVAHVAVVLASERASYVSAVALSIDGGLVRATV